MEGSIKWKDPNFTVFKETVNALNALDAARMNIDTEGFEMLSLCSPYTRHIANAFESIIELAAVSLGFTRRNNPDGVKYVKGCPLNNDYCEMSKTDFIDMIYRSRYDQRRCNNIKRRIGQSLQLTGSLQHGHFPANKNSQSNRWCQ